MTAARVRLTVLGLLMGGGTLALAGCSRHANASVLEMWAIARTGPS
jgi:hypothetical protein